MAFNDIHLVRYLPANPDAPSVHVGEYALPRPARDVQGRQYLKVYTVELFTDTGRNRVNRFPSVLIVPYVFGDKKDAFTIANQWLDIPEKTNTLIASRLPSRISNMNPEAIIEYGYPEARRILARKHTSPTPAPPSAPFSKFHAGERVCANSGAGYFIGTIGTALGQDAGVTWYSILDSAGAVMGTSPETALRPIAYDVNGNETCLPYDRGLANPNPATRARKITYFTP